MSPWGNRLSSSVNDLRWPYTSPYLAHTPTPRAATSAAGPSNLAEKNSTKFASRVNSMSSRAAGSGRLDTGWWTPDRSQEQTGREQAEPTRSTSRAHRTASRKCRYPGQTRVPYRCPRHRPPCEGSAVCHGWPVGPHRGCVRALTLAHWRRELDRHALACFERYQTSREAACPLFAAGPWRGVVLPGTGRESRDRPGLAGGGPVGSDPMCLTLAHCPAAEGAPNKGLLQYPYGLAHRWTGGGTGTNVPVSGGPGRCRVPASRRRR